MLIQKLKDLPKKVPNLISLDFETKSIDDKTIEGFSFSFRSLRDETKGEMFYVPLSHEFNADDVWNNIEYNEGIKYLKWLVTGRRIILHNSGFDLIVLHEHGIDLAIENVEDTMLMHWVLDTERPHGLKDIMESEFGKKVLTYEEAKNLGFEKFVWYAEHDAFWTYRLFLILSKEMENYPKTYKLYREYEMPFVEVMMDMNYHNNEIRIDKKLLEGYVQIIAEEISIVTDYLKEELGDINFNSSQQLAVALKKSGYKVKFREPTEKMIEKASKKGIDVKGNPALGEGDLLELQEKQGGEIIDLVLYNRMLVKLNSTYISKINNITTEKKYKKEPIHILTGYRFVHHGTRSGRLSSSGATNMQNMVAEPVPIVMRMLGYLQEAGFEKKNKRWLTSDEVKLYVERAEKEKKIKSITDKCSVDLRKIFIPMPGCKFIGADFSQIELRMVAHLANDKTMLDFFKSGADIHQQTADKATAIAGFTVSRRYAKTLNFGLIYGLYYTTLAKRLGIDKEEARKMYNAYFALFHDVASFIKEVHKSARRSHFVQTILGRRRNMATLGILSDEFGKVNYAQNSSVSTIVSGSSADLIKIAMINIRKRLPKVIMRLQIHDELLCEVKEEDADKMMLAVKKEMEEAMKLKVPVIADAHVGDSWRACHS